MKTYHIQWTTTETIHYNAEVTSQVLADALGLTVAEVEATEDMYELDLVNGLARVESMDNEVGSETFREVESVEEV